MSEEKTASQSGISIVMTDEGPGVAISAEACAELAPHFAELTRLAAESGDALDPELIEFIEEIRLATEAYEAEGAADTAWTTVDLATEGATRD